MVPLLLLLCYTLNKPTVRTVRHVCLLFGTLTCHLSPGNGAYDTEDDSALLYLQ